MTCSSASITAAEAGGANTLSALPCDVLRTHILTRLDGPTLTSAGCASTQLRELSSEESLWRDICHSAWPSTKDPRVNNLISTFPKGPLSFFSDSFPLLVSGQDLQNPSLPFPPSELISAVDINYRDDLVFSKVQETQVQSDWFRCSPFCIDLLDPKDAVPTPIQYSSDGESMYQDLAEQLMLSWIVIDPTGRRAANLSSRKPVSVQRHCLSDEIQVRFATILTGDGASTDPVQCVVVVTCGGCVGGELQVREVRLQLEDMEGKSLRGEQVLVLLQRGLDCGKRKKGRREEERESFEEYVEMRRAWRERKLRRETREEVMCMAFGFSVFAAFLILALFHW